MLIRRMTVEIDRSHRARRLQADDQHRLEHDLCCGNIVPKLISVARPARSVRPRRMTAARRLPLSTEIFMSAHAQTTLHKSAPAALVAGMTFVFLWMIVTGTI